MIKTFCDGCGKEITETEHLHTSFAFRMEMGPLFYDDNVSVAAEACTIECVPVAVEKMFLAASQLAHEKSREAAKAAKSTQEVAGATK